MEREGRDRDIGVKGKKEWIDWKREREGERKRSLIV